LSNSSLIWVKVIRTCTEHDCKLTTEVDPKSKPWQCKYFVHDHSHVLYFPFHNFIKCTICNVFVLFSCYFVHRSNKSYIIQTCYSKCKVYQEIKEWNQDQSLMLYYKISCCINYLYGCLDVSKVPEYYTKVYNWNNSKANCSKLKIVSNPIHRISTTTENSLGISITSHSIMCIIIHIKH